MYSAYSTSIFLLLQPKYAISRFFSTFAKMLSSQTCIKLVAGTYFNYKILSKNVMAL